MHPLDPVFLRLFHRYSGDWLRETPIFECGIYEPTLVEPHKTDSHPGWFYGNPFQKLPPGEVLEIPPPITASRLRTVDCAPVVDVPVSGAHDIIGDRALGQDPHMIATLGRAVCDGLLDEGVSPVIKHMPGHGRARADSHKDLPRVSESIELLEKTDFKPFRLLSDMPYAMTAHIVFDAIDAERPATVSSRVIKEIIRGAIGFDGVVLSDDIGMEALAGTPAERAKAVIEAGCDVVLECWGKLDVMQSIAPEVPRLSDASAERLVRAEAMRLARQADAPPLAKEALSDLNRLIDQA